MRLRSEWPRGQRICFAFVLACMASASCGDGERARAVADLGARLGAPDAPPVARGAATARVTLPAQSDGRVRVEDIASGATVAFRMAGAKRVPGQTLDGYLVFAGAHPSGASLLHRALPSGTEDYVSFRARPAAADVRYVVTLGPEVAGLRLVEGTLEMVDGGGAPRLRMEPPYVVGADGVRTDAVVAIEGCAVDRNPAAPWGRQVVPPGASDCTVRVTWPDARVAYPAVLDPRWTSTSTTMTTTRQGHTATLLSTGNVLVVGGTTNGNTATALASAELYNPATNTWAATASMPADAARTLHTATQLKVGSQSATSGKVLIAGGTNGTAMYNCQLYDPATGTWDQTTSFSGLGRYSHTATLLADGMVLVTGGIRGSSPLSTAEVFAPEFAGWAATSNKMPAGLKFHQAVLLTTSNSQLSNKVLVFGGNNGTGTASTVALYDPGTAKFTSLTALSTPREGHTATMLANGNILVTGGKNGSTVLNTTLIFNPSTGTGTWSSAGTMTAARQAHSATLLSSSVAGSGSVLVAGGNDGTATLDSAELWDGNTTWTATTALPSPTQGHTATLLGNGAVLVAGGVNGSTTLNTGRLYDGSFGLACTSNSQCATGFCANGVCCDTACNGGCGVCNLPGKVGTCSAASNTTVCRESSGACNPAETCDGTSLNCPADAVSADGTSCSDGNACTQTDTCQAGACVGGNPVACAVADACQGAGTCNPATGTCSAAAAPDGQACEDGNRCTVGDSCSKGACLPGPTNVCTAPSDNKYARVIDLGASMSASFAHRINNSGEVVGSEKPNGSYFEGTSVPSRAYVWSEAAGKVYLPAPMDYADDINEAGVIAGRAGVTYARYDRAHDAAPVLMGMASDRQCHLNASGVVTGGAYFGAPPLLSMLRWNGGSAEQLPTLPSGLEGFGMGIDDDGTVVGYQYVSQDTIEAIRYTDARGTEVLTDLLPPGSSWFFTFASFVRNGVLIGTGTNPAGLHHAYRMTTTATGDFQRLDDLGVPDGYDALAPNIVQPTQMSANGEIVGAIIEAGANTWPENAFIYTDTLGRPVLLSSLVDPNSGWHLNAAFGINDNHEVVGYGTHDGQTRAFKMNLPDMSPCPPPADGCHVPVARDLLTGLCSYPNAADNIACDDQDPTAIGKTCQAGRCVAPSLITPSLVGIAVEGSVTKAIFNYTMTTSTAVTIPYGPANGLYDDTGALIPAPTQQPPSVFEPTAHPPFVVAIPGTQITWKVNGQSVTADAGALPGLAVTTLSDGTHDVTFSDGSRFNLDSTPPADPVAAAEPSHGDPFNGVLSGSLSVTPSGGAIYSVPISIPPGVAGMAPNLSLVYNSQGGTGLAGQGWQMAGLSVIQRCPKTALRDGAAGPVVMDALGTATSDGLCLDGQKMFEQSPTGSGTYRLEKDDFSGIRLLSSGVFQVTTKSGEIRTYGSATQIVDQPTGQTGIWALDRVTDPWGNFFTIEYNDGKGDYLVRGLLPTRIRYTGHETNGAQDVDPFYDVTFQYGPRMDSTVTRIGTTSVPMNQLLSGIVTPRGTYSLQYGQNEFDTPLLAEIDYCAPADATHPQAQCLKPLTFGWNDNPVGREIAPTYQWTQAPGYAVPADYVNASVGRAPFTNFLAMGSQFVDLNADGLPELVMARNGRSGVKHSFNYAYRNTGTGFDPDHFHRIPVPTFLSEFVDDTHEVPTSVRFADMDGDGRLDIIQGSVQVTCQSPTDCYVCPTNDTASDCPGTTHTASPAVWLNRINEGQGWLYQPEYEHIPFLTQRSIDFNTPQQSHATPYVVADMNGDGCADLIQATFASESRVGPVMSYSLMVNNCKNLTFSTPDSTAGWVTTTFEGRAELSFTDSLPYDLDPAVVDVNRDGLPDLIAYKYVTGPDNVLDEYEVAFINKDGASFLPPIVHQPTASATVDADKNGIANADFDGDGYYDALAFESLYGVNGNLNSYKSQVGIAISDGSGLGFQPSSAVRVKELIATAPSATGDPNDFAFALMDVNGDGLADLIRNHPATTNGHGEVFVNRRNGWETFGGATYIDWSHTTTLNTPVPMVPNDRLACLVPDYGYPSPSGCVGPTPVVNNGTAYVDLDGDGLVDVIKDSSTYKDATDGSDSRAWLNKFQVPVITKFPNQLANPTVVTYVSTSSGAAQSGTAPTYTETGIVEAGTTYAPVPIRVVASVAKDSAVGSTATTTYQYMDLRNSAYGYGPQGFKGVTVTDPSRITTLTTYAQAYPFTGLPVRVDRTNVLGQLSTTFTTYCLDQSDTQCSNIWNQSVPARQTFFIHPSKIEEHTLVPADITTDTTYQFDSRGNPSVTITIARAAGSSAETATGQIFRTETHNNYGDEGSPTQLQGKVKRTQVITAIDAPAPTSTRVHTTTYDYDTRFGALALTKKSIEPDSTDPGMRLDTAYGYDNFGNVKVTTECAADFDHCGDLGATGPAELPYRITLTSYTTSDFNAPSGPGLTSSLGYGDGRFPVKMTDPMGHTSYVAYDPLRGVAIQKTDQNGVHQCSIYDRLGNLTATVARCGSVVPLTTRTERYEVSDPTLPRELTVTVTRPPVGGATWAYADALGRGTVTRSYGFDGGFTQTETIFDALGRVSSSSKPHKLGDTIFASVPIYDSLSRVQETDSVIGPLTLNGPAYVDQVKSDFSGGLTVPSQHLVNGAWQTRTETKYVNGKVASVKDAKETETDYTYDADGNPYEVRTGGVLLEQTVFDVRGRKTSSFSADMGSWTYVYDGFGELVQQTDGNNHTSSMTYDQLGRLLTRDDQDEGVSQWIYDDPASGGGIGKLSFMIGPPDTNLGHDCPLPSGATVSGGNRATKTYHYTQFGQLDTTVECIDGEPFTTTNTYDEFGRQLQIRYPSVGSSQLVVGYHYTSLGFLQYLTDDSTDSAVLWRAIAMNAIGQVTDEQTKNGVETVSTTNPTNGWLLRSSAVAHADGNKQIQWLDFSYDQAGNLTRRRRLDSLVTASSDESFTYDPLNRVHTAAIDVATPVSYTGSSEYDYDDLGNLTVKDGKQYTNGTGCQSGGQVGPHALCAIDSDGSYAYDGNGNMTAGRGRAVTYNHRNKSRMISDGTNSVQFVYGADGDRVTQIATPASGLEARTIYVGLGDTGKSLYERTTTGNDVTNVDFIYAPGAAGINAIAVRTMTAGGAVTGDRYFTFDNVGSTMTVTDESGRLAQDADSRPSLLGYDPWGARRAPEGNPVQPEPTDAPVGNRGFGGHEVVPALGLVNMNGRVYDPDVGRFLSTDPNIQFPTDLQGYNRYAYVLNNPLSHTDPTGYFLGLSGLAWANIGLSVAGIVACAGSGVGCGVIFALAATTLNTTAAVLGGASASQIAGSLIMGTALGVIGGGMGSAASSVLGGSLGAVVASGAISNVFTASFSTMMSGRFSGTAFGENLMMSVGMGLLQTGVNVLLAQPAPVSQASDAAQAQSGGASGLAGRDKYRVDTRDAVKANAIENGETLTGRIGDTPVTIYGGDAADRVAVMTDLTKITQESSRGQYLADIIEDSADGSGNPKPVEVVIIDSGSLRTRIGSFTLERTITLDMSDTSRTYDSPAGPGQGTFSLTRVLAHELGHVAGYADIDSSRFGESMYNVGSNENPIMRELGDYNDRKAY